MNKELAVKVSESIISNEIALDFNERLKHTVLYKKMLKNRLR